MRRTGGAYAVSPASSSPVGKRSAGTLVGAGLAILVLAISLAACAGPEGGAPETSPSDSPAPAQPTGSATVSEPSPRPELPGRVAATRDAIENAAHSFNYDALEALLDPATFSYSFGESGDPTGYWRMLEEEAEVPILGDFLPVILSMHYARQDGVYVWPAAATKEPSSWTEEDLAELRTFYPEEDIRGFEQAGGYLGYRVGIREDGSWLFFVAGD